MRLEERDGDRRLMLMVQVSSIVRGLDGREIQIDVIVDYIRALLTLF